MKLPVTVIILTFNEEKNIKDCLEAVVKLTDNILIVDSHSTDSTLEIARGYNTKVLVNVFKTHTLQWKYALENEPFNNEWILALDADQVLSDELVSEIRSLLSSDNKSFDGYFIKRRMFFLGKWIRHGGYYPLYLLKLFRKKAVYLDEGEIMEHHFYLHGAASKCSYDLTEANKNETMEFWLKKHIKYAALQASEEFNSLKSDTNKGRLFGNVADRKLYLRKNVWEKLPLFLRPSLYFIYRYFILLGILDGRRGLIFHFLQAFWYRFTVDSFIYEMKRNK